MISLIDEIILSYIFTNKSIDLYEIKRVVNEPIFLILEAIDRLYFSGYFIKNGDEVELTDKAYLYAPKQWGIWFEQDKVDAVDKFNSDYNLQISRNQNGFPIINSQEFLRDILNLEGVNRSAYHEFDIYLDGKTRRITSPSKKLKKRQKWILNNILNQYVLNENVHGFVRGRSIVTNASCHIGQHDIGCIDIKDFFPSVTTSQVEKTFIDMGYDDEISITLADLCVHNGCLPQGAPTSPLLANIILNDFDFEVSLYAKDNNLKYSRYADDITLSGNEIHAKDIDYLYDRLSAYGFYANKDKTHIMSGKHRKIVTGLIVNDLAVKVPRSYKRKLEQEIYYCTKYGVNQHLKNTQRSHAVNFREYLYGKAYFIKMVEPNTGEAFLSKIDNIIFD